MSQVKGMSRLHKSAITFIALVGSGIMWVNHNLGVSLWFLLLAITVNCICSLLLKRPVRDVPQSLMGYGFSIGLTILAQRQGVIDIHYASSLIVLLLLYEIKVTYPLFVESLKRLGVAPAAATTIASDLQQVIDAKVSLPPQTGTGQITGANK